jgi:hypothetical protein
MQESKFYIRDEKYQCDDDTRMFAYVYENYNGLHADNADRLFCVNNSLFLFKDFSQSSKRFIQAITIGEFENYNELTETLFSIFSPCCTVPITKEKRDNQTRHNQLFFYSHDASNSSSYTSHSPCPFTKTEKLTLFIFLDHFFFLHKEKTFYVCGSKLFHKLFKEDKD